MAHDRIVTPTVFASFRPCCFRCGVPLVVGEIMVVTTGHTRRYHKKCFIEY